MANKNSNKQDGDQLKIIVAIVILLAIVSLSAGEKQATEPNDIQSYGLNQLKNALSYNTCEVVDIGLFYEGNSIICIGEESKGFAIEYISLWSEGKYNSCSNFMNDNPHSYLLGTDPIPCYMENVGETSFPLYKDFHLKDGACVPCDGFSCTKYYSCSENDLFIISSRDSDTIYDYHQSYKIGPIDSVQKQVKYVPSGNGKITKKSSMP